MNHPTNVEGDLGFYTVHQPRVVLIEKACSIDWNTALLFGVTRRTSMRPTHKNAMPDLKHMLTDAKTIAVVGLSDRTHRTSYRIARYLQDVGYRIIPVNPRCEEILGERCYPTLPDVPTDITIDIVNIFRDSRHTAAMVQQAIDRIDGSGEHPAIWTQIGVSSHEAKAKAEQADLAYVEDRCILVEHQRLLGEPAW